MLWLESEMKFCWIKEKTACDLWWWLPVVNFMEFRTTQMTHDWACSWENWWWAGLTEEEDLPWIWMAWVLDWTKTGKGKGESRPQTQCYQVPQALGAAARAAPTTIHSPSWRLSHARPADQTQVVRHGGGKHLYLPSHLTSPRSSFYRVWELNFKSPVDALLKAFSQVRWFCILLWPLILTGHRASDLH